MADDKKALKPPYAPWGTYLNFITELGEAPIPTHIDKSLMPKMSGGMQSVMVAALRATGMIDSGGVPTKRLNDFVEGSDDQKKEAVREALQSAYPFFFSGEISLDRATPGHFDRILRESGGVSGSTLDKVANFFLSASEYAEIPVSSHLKSRKPTFKRSSSPKPKSRADSSTNNDGGNNDAIEQKQTQSISEKALEYRLVDLMREAGGDPEVMQAIITVITWLQTRDQERLD